MKAIRAVPADLAAFVVKSRKARKNPTPFGDSA
jgi:hypothetical protein